MSNDISTFDLGFMDKIAESGNPAAPVKSSLPSGSPEAKRFAPYLNTGVSAGAHVAGSVATRPQPWPGHVNIGDKSPGTQTAGDVRTHSSPDSGVMGPDTKGDVAVTKSAAFAAGMESQIDLLTS